MINYPHIAVIFFFVLCASCHTAPEVALRVYTLRTEYLANTDSYPADEVADNIEHILSEREFRYVSNYENGLFHLETQWRETAASLDTISNLGRRFSGRTDNYTTEIKYYFIIGETYYSLRAVKRNRNGASIEEPPPNGVAEVTPGSELWRHLETFAQEINHETGVLRYNLKTKREPL